MEIELEEIIKLVESNKEGLSEEFKENFVKFCYKNNPNEDFVDYSEKLACRIGSRSAFNFLQSDFERIVNYWIGKDYREAAKIAYGNNRKKWAVEIYVNAKDFDQAFCCAASCNLTDHVMKTAVDYYRKQGDIEAAAEFAEAHNYFGTAKRLYEEAGMDWKVNELEEMSREHNR